MKPIRAMLRYKAIVPCNPENPKHAAFIGMKDAEEDRYREGYVTEILPLTDGFSNRILDGKDEKGYNVYKDVPISKTGVYVVFWMDEVDSYKLSIQDVNDIQSLPQEMNNYVRSFYTK